MPAPGAAPPGRRAGAEKRAVAARRPFALARGQWRAGGVALATVARRFGTPCYVYDEAAMATALGEFQAAFADRPHLVCAAVKANDNLAILRALARAGAGFDIVSGGELRRVLAAGGKAARVVFSGVGKTAEEMDAALAAGILLFNVESEPELELLAARARAARRRARFGVRLNPDVAAPTHPHIATGLHRHKFGVSIPLARRLYRRWGGNHWLEAAAVSCHIGSQILDTAPFAAAVGRVAELARELRAAGLPLRFLDAGGGLGIAYRPGEKAPTLAAYAAALKSALRDLPVTLLLEPGRRLVAAAGALLARVLYVKETEGRRFIILDAACNDLMRPALYGAYHEIVALRPRPGRARPADVVGPVCESGDTFARDRRLPPLRAGDFVALLDAGAYGYSLASNYNARPRPAEALIAAGRVRQVRAREDLSAALRRERRGRA